MPAPPPPKRHPYNQWSPDARALDLVGDKWTLLIVRDLASGPRRFVELQRVLPGISTEQLRSLLQRLDLMDRATTADELLEADAAFHACIAAGAGNAVLASVLDSFWPIRGPKPR